MVVQDLNLPKSFYVKNFQGDHGQRYHAMSNTPRGNLEWYLPVSLKFIFNNKGILV